MAGNINKAYQWTINTCNAPNVGYDQSKRNQVTVNGITYYDCSSLMWYALKEGGFDVDSAYTGPAACFRTWEMAATCERLGFNILNARTEIWKPGDILVDDWRSIYLQHTEMVYEGPPASQASYGKTMGAHANESEGRPIPLADQVSINNYYTTPSDWWNQFNHLIRWGEGGATGYGVSKYVIAAICGNWFRESGINPGVYENLNVVPLTADVYGGYGLGQWTNSYNPNTQQWTRRRTDLINWLRDNGYDDDSGPGQLEYFIYENVWHIGPGTYGYKWRDEFPDLESFLRSDSTDLEKLTEVFLNCWEIGTTGLDLRYANAVKVLQYLSLHGNDQPGDWIKGNRYLSPEESLHNCLIVFQFLSSGGGGGGRPPHYIRNNMPIWMMINYHLI